ncbi:MAG: hypothetical protein IT200_03890 [Thermoleophilia bacterium]|nr:hypothetical protein [Thermoleophilia bacterium]
MDEPETPPEEGTEDVGLYAPPHRYTRDIPSDRPAPPPPDTRGDRDTPEPPAGSDTGGPPAGA